MTDNGVTNSNYPQLANHIRDCPAFERVAIAPDLDAFSSLVRNTILCLPRVKEVSTRFSLKEVKRTGILAVE